MSIYNKKIDKFKKSLILKSFSAGEMPNLSVISSASQDYALKLFKKINALNFIFSPPHSISKPDSENLMIAGLQEDILDIFEDIKDQTKETLRANIVYEIQRQHLLTKIKPLEYTTRYFKEAIHTSKQFVSESFATLGGIELKGDKLRNIPKSTARFNLSEQSISIPMKKNLIQKYNLEDITTYVEYPAQIKARTEAGNISDILSDTINEYWQTLVETDELSQLSVTLKVIFNTPIVCSSVRVSLISPKSTNIDIRLLSTDDEQIRVPIRSVNNSTEWDFPTIEISEATIIMSKDTPDDSDSLSYKYIFGIKNLHFIKSQTENEAVLVSVVYPIKKDFSTIEVIPTQEVPAKTEVKYYIGVDEGTNNILWQPIEPNLKKKIGGQKANYLENISNTTPEYAETMGIGLINTIYSVCNMPQETIPEYLKIYIGHNMWQTESIPIGTYAGLEAWEQSQNNSKSFSAIGTPLTLPSGNHYRFTAFVKASEARSTTYRVLKSSNFPTIIMLNSNTINPLGSNYNLHFKDGWNKVEIYATNNTEASQTISPLLDFFEIGEIVVGDKAPMTYVSPHVIKNVVPINDINKYSIIDQKIVVNYNPNNLDIQNSTGVKYLISWEEINKIQNNQGVRLMTVLRKHEDGRPSPKLFGYGIFFE